MYAVVALRQLTSLQLAAAAPAVGAQRTSLALQQLMHQLLSPRRCAAWGGPSCSSQQLHTGGGWPCSAAAVRGHVRRSSSTPAGGPSHPAGHSHSSHMPAAPAGSRGGRPSSTVPAAADGQTPTSSSTSGARPPVQAVQAAAVRAAPQPPAQQVAGAQQQQQQQQQRPQPVRAPSPIGRARGGPLRPPRPTTKQLSELQQQQQQGQWQQLPQHTSSNNLGGWPASWQLSPPMLLQQQQQQPQWQQQQSADSWGSQRSSAGAAAAEPDRRCAEALYVNMTGELHRVKEFDSGYKILSFKQVKIDNGLLTRTGWQPGDLDKALAALPGARTTSSRSTSSNTSSDPGSLTPQQRNILKWLTVVGDFSGASLCTAQAYRVSGEWANHSKYGWQVRAAHIEPAPEETDPITLLTSLPGVGPKTAEAIVSHFGSSVEDLNEVMSQPLGQAVAALMQVPKVGKAAALKIKKQWDKVAVPAADQQAELQQKLKLFPRLASRVSKYFGLDSDAPAIMQQVAKNPYALFRLIPGYDLAQADETAAAVGFDPGAPERGAAYLQDTLLKGVEGSGAYLTWAEAERATQAKLSKALWQGWQAGRSLRPAAELLVQEGRVVVEEQHLRGPPQLLLLQQKDQQHDQQQEQQGHHHHRHHHHHKLEQQALYEFEEVQAGWSDAAAIYLKEMHQAEQDILAYYLDAAQRCCSKLQDLQAQALQQQQGQQRSSRSRGSHSHRRSRKASHAAAAVAAGAGGDASSSSSSSGSSSSSSGGSSAGSLLLPTAVSETDAAAIDALQAELSQQLGKEVAFNEGQRVALVLAQQLPVMALTGGPGCGKTLSSQAIARHWLDAGRKRELSMAAPTGRAAQRLQEVLCGQHADRVSSSTIHRLLGYRNAAVAKRLAAEAAEAAEAAGDSKLEAQVLIEDAEAGGQLGPDLDLGSRCEHNANNPLPPGNFLVDEVSMMDTALAAALFNALRPNVTVIADGRRFSPHSSLVLVGDPDQLPPVGAGQPVADALAEGMLPCIDLRQIYRTAANSAIVTSAHAINRGEMPQVSAVWDIRRGFIASGIGAHVAQAAAQPGGLDMQGQVLFLRLPDHCTPADVAEAMQEATKQLVPRLQCEPARDVQVLSPIRGSDMGIDQLNARLQALLNPPVKGKKVLETKKALWREGDRVTHLKNNTNLDVFNGDQGYIESADPGNFKLVVRYPPRAKRAGDSSSSSNQRHGQAGRDRLASLSRDVDSFREGQDDGFHRVTYVGADISETLQLSWATTVHKAQGGEFPIVLLGVHKRVGKLLRRKMLYTAVSRAQKLLVIVGTQSAIEACLRDHKGSASESSRFRAKLRSARVAAGLPTIEKAVYGPDGWRRQQGA